MPVWLAIFSALGGSTLISLVITSVWHIIEKHANSEAEEKREAREIIKREEQQKEKAELLQEVRTLINPIASDINKIKAELDTDKEATVLNMRVQMKDLRDKYTEQGFADRGDKAMWNELYKKYSDMGGNHFAEYVDGWKADVEDLPLKVENN